METELQDFDVVSSRPLNSYRWQISADLTSFVAVLLGGTTYSTGHLGLGAKYRFGSHALRFQTEFYPNSRSTGWLGNQRVVSVNTSDVIYLHSSQTGRLIRSGFGLEKGWEKERGRFYILFDGILNGEQIDVYAYNRSVPIDQVGEFSSDGWQSYNRSEQQYYSYGVGLIPGVGYEIYTWKHIGFTLEAKLDLNTTVSPAYQIDDNANILPSGRTVYFRTFPLLDFRIHYRI
jgi:hypothetical protein